MTLAAAIGFGVVALIGLIVGSVLLVKKIERKRTEAIQAVADELGLAFHPTGDPRVAETIQHFHLFNQGHSHQWMNMLCGQSDDIELAVFGYRYTVGGGQHQSVISQTVMSFHSPELALPEFELRPEHIFHKFAQALGFDDIDFESHPVFSKKFNLKGPDEQAVREYFDVEILDALQPRDGISIEASSDQMIVYRSGKRLKPEQIRPFMEEGFEIYTLLKCES